MKKIPYTLALITTMFISSHATAGWIVGKISNILSVSANDTVEVLIRANHESAPSCAFGQDGLSKMIIGDASSEIGKRHVNMLIEAGKSGSTVNLVGNGQCNVHYRVETLVTIRQYFN